MKPLLALFATLLLSACAGLQTPTATAPAPTLAPTPTAAAAPAQQYPAWLEMKPGYAETCMNGGGCVPMTKGELQEMANEIMQRTMQVCRRTSI